MYLYASKLCAKNFSVSSPVNKIYLKSVFPTSALSIAQNERNYIFENKIMYTTRYIRINFVLLITILIYPK